jgi:bifunctional pyridoxal-dependent enzyme with beta-cystathionase and maltose regulon repressor activities
MSLESVKFYKDTLIKANQDGISVKILLLCHPHNPLGIYYPPEVVEAYLALCSKHNLYLIW